MKHRWIALMVFLGTSALFIYGTAPAATPGDAGEFIAAGATLAIPHAPSFPLYILLTKAFLTIVPIGAFSYRVGIFSAVCTAAATMTGFLFLYRYTGRLLASLLMCLSISLAAPMWMNAIVAEVFALHRFAVAALLLVITLAVRDRIRADRAAVFFAFIGGLTAGIHQTIVFAAPAYLVFGVLIRPFRRFLRVTAVASAFGLLGLSIYLTLPIRAGKRPPLNWGNPTTVDRLYRSFMRKDYGTLTLALGEPPERTAANTAHQLARFSKAFVRETGWPLAILGLAGLAIGVRRKDLATISGAVLLVSSGPMFFLLGNLPFDSQSEGIIQRFYISPIIALAGGCAAFVVAAPRVGTALAAAALVVGLGNFKTAAAHRWHTVVSDSAVSMIRAVPMNGKLFIDGGDDAFYGIAAELYGQGRRPDISVHDRGGLVFANPYGVDFRSLSRAERRERRIAVETRFLQSDRLFYLTMDRAILPGIPLRQRGFVFEANGNGPGFDWTHVCLRSVYPPPTDDYRTRALAAFFPYMRGLELLATSPENAIRYFRRAIAMAPDVDWLRVNLGQSYGQAAHQWLVDGRLDLAREAYADLLDLDGGAESTLNNLGVLAERQGDLPAAIGWYRAAAERYRNAPDPVYNLAVIEWKRANWRESARLFEEVLRRNPAHPTAAEFLREARRRASVTT